LLFASTQDAAGADGAKFLDTLEVNLEALIVLARIILQ